MATSNKTGNKNNEVSDKRHEPRERRTTSMVDRRDDAPNEKGQHLLSLIPFKGHLYPSTTEDYEYLRLRGVTTYRLPLSSLALLKKTRLTKAKVVYVPFMTMWQPFMEHLLSELAKFGDSNLLTAHSLVVHLPTENVHKLKTYLVRTSLFSRRYCISQTTDVKSRASDKTSLVKISFTYNEDLNNSYAFMSSGLTADQEDPYVEIPLAASVKLRLTRTVVNTVPAFQVTVLDKMGDTWSEALNRSGKALSISKQSLLESAMFLLEMS